MKPGQLLQIPTFQVLHYPNSLLWECTSTFISVHKEEILKLSHNKTNAK